VIIIAGRIGTPRRFGKRCGRMRQFVDVTGQVSMSGALVGKIGSVFTRSNAQHGGQESTILTLQATLLQEAMVIVCLPDAFQGQMRMDKITRCPPYGAGTISGENGARRRAKMSWPAPASRAVTVQAWPPPAWPAAESGPLREASRARAGTMPGSPWRPDAPGPYSISARIRRYSQ
jgi:hypothetical protein